MGLPFSKKSKNTAKVDVDAVIGKLKALYRKYAGTYGDRVFNVHAFEQRYHDALVAKANLNNFCHAEITVFEELKKRVEPKESPRDSSKYSDVADRIIEENLRMIRKYRRIDFHPDAEEETKHLLGAVTDFYYEWWGRLRGELKPLGERSFNDFAGKLENDFAYYVIPTRGMYSRAVDDYMLVLSRKNPKESERASYNFIKYGAILLNNCLKLTADALNLTAQRPDNRENTTVLTAVREELRCIVTDFRLTDIRGY
jgi:hypothetical protein